MAGGGEKVSRQKKERRKEEAMIKRIERNQNHKRVRKTFKALR